MRSHARTVVARLVGRAHLARRSLAFDASGARVSPEAVAGAVAELRERGVEVVDSADSEDAARRVALASRDFYWYSPKLKRELRGMKGDALVVARSEADVVNAAGVAARREVPLTPRGAGTGNYGQAVPMRGGIVLDLSPMDQIVSFDARDGIVRARAGINLARLEEETRKEGWELRQHPSTRRTATLGGFVAGGSTGVGAMVHGGLAEDGAVLGLRVVTAEPSPRTLELRGRDVFPVVHAYGTNGVVTEVEVPLARAQPWWDGVYAFSTLGDAAKFALELGEAPAIVAREVSVHQSPTFARELAHTALGGMLRDVGAGSRHVVLAQMAKPSLGPARRLAKDNDGDVCFEPSRSEDLALGIPLYEYAWNHTTLHALKRDKSVTYLQAAMMPGKALDLVSAVERRYDVDELVQHLEVVRFGGGIGFASLALLRPGADAEAAVGKVEEVMRWHEENDIPVFNPHTHVLEDGGMKQTDWAQLGFKSGADPNGVLNPGKMRAWEEGKATTEASDPRGSFSAAYRLAQSDGASANKYPNKKPNPSSTEERANEETNEESNRTNEESNAAHTTTTRERKMSRLWSEWTTEDFATLDLSDAVAVLPLGATEAHGPHLPLGVDSMHNAALLARALELVRQDVQVLALPPLDIGVSCEHGGFAGTVGVSPETAATQWEEIGACVARAGIRKLILYNSHGGNHALAEVVARRLRLKHRMIAALALNLALDVDGCAASLFPEDELRFGIHGGGLETSVMMHLRPELVDAGKALNFASSANTPRTKGKTLQRHATGFGVKTGWASQDLNPHGVVGDAADASCAKGAKLVESSALGLARLIEEMHATCADEWTGTAPLYPPQGTDEEF